jgi:glycosyltransferase involved in cell wall biosynthesis
MLDVTIVVGSFGDETWFERGALTAEATRERFDVHVIHWHGRALASARNAAAAEGDGEFLVFLDADDELEPGYLDAAPGAADVLIPRVRYILGGHIDRIAEPRHVQVVDHHRLHGPCEPDCLGDGNFIVVGAPIRRSLFQRVGGFRDLPVYEDYDLWVRCWRAGAVFAYSDGPVYRAHVNPQGRNRSLTAAERLRVEDEIRLYRGPGALA